MHPMYDLAKMVCSLILILLFLKLVVDMTTTYIEYLAMGNSRIVQEYLSGFLSMSNFAPQNFYVINAFPEITHKLKVTKTPPLINITSGGVVKAPKIKFREYEPLGYTLSDKIVISGDCIDRWCEFSSNELNALKLIKSDDNVNVVLNFKQRDEKK
ncbi:MAG: hypothetical protein QXQ40_00550 [Candidatus Aenigmatarchaeota archaeon]